MKKLTKLELKIYIEQCTNLILKYGKYEDLDNLSNYLCHISCREHIYDKIKNENIKTKN